MFDRFTETARRVIFFARYEASQHGTSFIETASLLLGLLREDKALVARLLPAPGALAHLYADVEALFPPSSQTIPTTVDLPLSRAAKRCLTHAVEEADRRHQKAIQPVHLLWGLLTEGGPEAACLNSYGITLESASPDLARLPGENPRRVLLRQALDLIPENRLDAALILLGGMASRKKFEVSGTGRGGPFHFSFDDQAE